MVEMMRLIFVKNLTLRNYLISLRVRNEFITRSKRNLALLAHLQTKSDLHRASPELSEEGNKNGSFTTSTIPVSAETLSSSTLPINHAHETDSQPARSEGRSTYGDNGPAVSTKEIPADGTASNGVVINGGDTVNGEPSRYAYLQHPRITDDETPSKRQRIDVNT